MKCFCIVLVLRFGSYRVRSTEYLAISFHRICRTLQALTGGSWAQGHSYTNESSNNLYYSACYFLRSGHPSKFFKVHETARALKIEYFLELCPTAFFSSSSSLPHQPHIHSSVSPTTVHRFNYYSATLTTIRHHRPTRTHILSKENHYPPPHHSSSRCNSEPLFTALWLIIQFKTTQALPVDTTTTILVRRLV